MHLLVLCFNYFLVGWLVFSLAQTAMQIAPPVPELAETLTVSFLKFLVQSPSYWKIPCLFFLNNTKDLKLCFSSEKRAFIKFWLLCILCSKNAHWLIQE